MVFMKIKNILKWALYIVISVIIIITILFVSFYLYVSPISYSKSEETLNTRLDFSILNSIDEKSKKVVLNYFASSKKWKVERMYYNSSLGRKGINSSGYLMAHKRYKNIISHFTGPLIIFNEISNSYTNNYKFIDSRKSPLHLTIDEIGYLPPSKKSRKILRNVIKGYGLNILIDNVFYDPEKSGIIISDLNSIDEKLENIIKNVNSSNFNSIINKIDSTSYKITDVNEFETYQTGNYIKAKGYVNVGIEGRVYLRIIKIDTGREISHPGRPNEEFIGWNDNDRIKFYFELKDQHIIYGKEGEEFDAELQLWFDPLDDNSEELLVTKEIKRIKIGYRGF